MPPRMIMQRLSSRNSLYDDNGLIRVHACEWRALVSDNKKVSMRAKTGGRKEIQKSEVRSRQIDEDKDFRREKIKIKIKNKDKRKDLGGKDQTTPEILF